jgi:ribosomal protein S3
MFDYVDEDDWMSFRAEALAYAKEREERVLKTWLTEIGYKPDDPIGYEINRSKKITKIYSTRPGPLIGLRGINVEKLKQILSNEYRGKWKVEFIEVRGGFISI